MPETPSLSLSVSPVSIHQDPGEVCRKLRPLGREIETCRLRALRGKPGSPDEVSVSLAVDDVGHVEQVTIDGSAEAPARSRLAACLSRLMRKLTFSPQVAIYGTVSISFDFR
jgi:hypothetical protein